MVANADHANERALRGRDAHEVSAGVIEAVAQPVIRVRRMLRDFLHKCPVVEGFDRPALPRRVRELELILAAGTK